MSTTEPNDDFESSSGEIVSLVVALALSTAVALVPVRPAAIVGGADRSITRNTTAAGITEMAAPLRGGFDERPNPIRR